MKVQLDVYNICKRWQAARVKETVEYYVENFEVLQYSDEEALRLGITESDDDNEYLILYLEDGNKIVYCNTCVDLYPMS